jgi:hypothetical protein
VKILSKITTVEYHPPRILVYHPSPLNPIKAPFYSRKSLFLLRWPTSCPSTVLESSEDLLTNKEDL